ncbi:PLP-dependent aminotransferase family protein [Archangium violaceum]|uniref:aminotransferase-like domain-containing protein n=1 Tax=Archangium violaceum TaxID=83451 RepID=UPI002B292EBA|nr:PLP-dependent aminotransferase family protein [Archangium gephyra]
MPPDSSTPPLPMASWLRQIARTPQQDSFELLSRPGMLSLALGLPAAELFPGEALARAAGSLSSVAALQYRAPEESLKPHVIELMSARGVRCSASQIFFTVGAQQGMSLLLRLLLDPGQEVMAEEISYTGFAGALAPHDCKLLTVPTNVATGIDVDAVEARLRNGARPRVLYVMADGHNPLGVSLPLEKRRRLAALAREFGFYILEDDAYGQLCFGAGSPAIRSFEERWVLYIGSFSKILAPSLRLGWVVVPEELAAELANVKEGSDLDVASFSQHVASAALGTGFLGKHVAALKEEYRQRRDAMERALAEHFPSGASWSHPEGGFFTWVELPRHLNATQLLRRAADEQRVAFMPGGAFSLRPGAGDNCMRLCFSYCAPAVIEDGVARLGKLLRSVM